MKERRHCVGGTSVFTTDEIISQLRDASVVRLVILRGLPGSGKSTLAQALVEQLNFVHIEADAHFTAADGAYAFNPARVADAHAVGQQQADAALVAGKRVVIANTNVRLWELAPYIGLAALRNCVWQVIECRGKWPNIHAVPVEIMTRMAEKFEALPERFAARVWQTES